MTNALPELDLGLMTWLMGELWHEGVHPGAPQVYALLDGGRDERIEPMVRSSGAEFTCLYAGKLEPALSAVAPYLVHLDPHQPFTGALLDAGWGASWGYFVVAPADISLRQLRRHFRTLLKVEDFTGNPLVFRFYDPRVLRAYLPTCLPEERSALFGPCRRFIAETATPGSLIAYPAVASADAGGHVRTLPSFK
ncbi:DUF4123 domain-containing protein [Pseudomonas sp. B11(2017)]|uniref:DUF4123 domain-containing protein n=1 Tax=Pseudomonas sp. B11(2017) TaxID=1981748 RepID=UPI000A1FD7E9|nr:DUF4123 domain-containing protein [Pseudomonas sp. B11(2017)]